MRRNKITIFLVLILAVNLVLTVIGINWGLPDRWCVDEQVANSLKLIASKSPFSVITNVHPQLYNLFLGGLFLPYLLILKLTGYPLQVASSLAGISWMEMAHSYPGFASGLYLVARSSSLLLGLLTLYILFRTTSIIAGDKAGLFAALALGLSMGFVETNHLAKHTSLVAFLVLLVLFFCLKAISQKEYFRRYFYLASFFAGLAATAKLDGIISVLFIIGVAVYSIFQDASKKKLSDRIKVFDLKLLFSSSALFISGILIGWPALLVSFDKYYQTKSTQNGIFYGGFHVLSFGYLKSIAGKLKDTLILIMRNFSLPLGLVVLYSVWDFFKHIKKYPYSSVIATMLIPYTFISLAYFTEYPGTSTKLFIHALIIFCIFTGKVIADLFASKKGIFFLRRFFICLIFLFAFFYTFQSDLFFWKRDTRYLSTAWLLNNIPANKTIEHYQEGENLFSTSVIPFKYDVIFWGRHSKDYRGVKSLYRRDVHEKLAYRQMLNAQGSSADFFIIALGGEFVMSQPPEGSFIQRLDRGEDARFKLIKVFKPESNFFFNPRPEWSSPEIYIYERIS